MEEVTGGELYMLEQVDTLDNGIQILRPKAPDRSRPWSWCQNFLLDYHYKQFQFLHWPGAKMAAMFAGEEGKLACGRVHLHAKCHGQAPMTAVTKFKLLEVHSHYAWWDLWAMHP